MTDSIEWVIDRNRIVFLAQLSDARMICWGPNVEDMWQWEVRSIVRGAKRPDVRGGITRTADEAKAAAERAEAKLRADAEGR